MGEFLKYLPIIMQTFQKFGRYAKYLIYLPTLLQLISAAEKRWPKKGSGTSKLAWVSEQFGVLVTFFESAGLLPTELAKALRDGAPQIITAIVQILNAAGWGGDDGTTGGGTGTGTGKYETVLTAYPARANYQAGDVVYQRGDNSAWLVRQRGIGIGQLPDPWHEVETFV